MSGSVQITDALVVNRLQLAGTAVANAETASRRRGLHAGPDPRRLRRQRDRRGPGRRSTAPARPSRSSTLPATLGCWPARRAPGRRSVGRPPAGRSDAGRPPRRSARRRSRRGSPWSRHPRDRSGWSIRRCHRSTARQPAAPAAPDPTASRSPSPGPGRHRPRPPPGRTGEASGRPPSRVRSGSTAGSWTGSSTTRPTPGGRRWRARRATAGGSTPDRPMPLPASQRRRRRGKT